ncbi:MAG: SapC family protein [Sphingopyxis sp.]|nr:SapC family protein [Sphingopyxis sp.]
MSRHAVLDKNIHRDLHIHTGAGAQWGDDMMATLTVPREFRRVQAHFPILFRREVGRDDFNALALFGFETGENLFLDGDRWDARYRPLSLAIQPFLVGRPADGDGPGQIHIDMGHARIAADGDIDGVRLFDPLGMATPYLEAVAERLGDLDQGYREGAAFYDALRAYELLEPFSLEVTLDNGSVHSLVGFHIIDEARVQALDAAALGALHADGHLMPMFMAMASLSQLSVLIERKNSRLRGG